MPNVNFAHIGPHLRLLVAPGWNAQLAAVDERELKRGGRNRATLAVARNETPMMLHCIPEPTAEVHDSAVARQRGTANIENVNISDYVPVRPSVFYQLIEQEVIDKFQLSARTVLPSEHFTLFSRCRPVQLILSFVACSV